MTLPIQFLDQVRERTVLSALIGRSIKVIKAGREHKACCPFHHEDTPSFTINDAKSFWHCFGCGRHGDAIRWLTDHGGLPFIEAVAQLAEAAGMDMPKRSAAEVQKAARLDGVRPILAAADAFYRAQIEPSGAPREYLFKRGIGDALIEEFGIGWAPADRYALKALGATEQGLLDAGLIMRFDDESAGPVFRSRIMVPIADARGRTIGFGGRAMGQEQPKYKNSPQSEIFDKGRILFNLHRAANAARAAKRLIVVEGYMDVIGLAAVGVREAVAPMGTAVTPAQIERLWLHHHSPILMFDGDKAGQAAAIRACETALPMVGPQGRSLSICVLPAGQDPDDLARAGGREAVEAVIAGAVRLNEFVFNRVVENDGSIRSPEEIAAQWARLDALARTIVDDETRARYLAMWRTRFDRVHALVAPEPLASFTKADDGDYWFPETEDRSEAQLIAIVRRVLELRQQRREISETIRDGLTLAKAIGFDSTQITAVVRMIEAHPGEREDKEAQLALYRRVLGVKGPMTEAMMPSPIDARNPGKVPARVKRVSRVMALIGGPE